MINLLEIASISEKIKAVEASIANAQQLSVPTMPSRDIEVVDIRALRDKQLRNKVSLFTPEGEARLLHDVANIELQAMELGLRTLIEFPQAPDELQKDMQQLVRSEAYHLSLCLDGIAQLGFKWGSWPIHLGLWQAVSPHDTLSDRMLIVHRYLEGTGLDAQEKILNKLASHNSRVAKKIIQIIRDEEIDHVRFGTDWFRKLVLAEGKNPDKEFAERIEYLLQREKHPLPFRREKIQREVRVQAGFNDTELDFLEQLQN